VLKNRSDTLLCGTASLTLIEKSVHKQGLVSSNLQGEMCDSNFTSVNRVQSPASHPNTGRALFLHAGSSAEHQADSTPFTGPRVRARCRQRKNCGGEMAEMCEITITAERRREG